MKALKTIRTLILLMILSLSMLPSARAQEPSRPYGGAVQACPGHTLGQMNGIPACMEGDNLHICENNFPETNFREYAEYLASGQNEFLTREEIDAVKTIDLSSRYVSDLRGLEYFRNLEEFRCANTGVTSLDMGWCSSLKILDCSRCGSLTELTIGGCSSLEKLYCNGCGLQELDVRDFPLLKELNCNGNMIVELDVSECPKLESLDCSGNRLVYLDLTGCSILKALGCNSNQLSELDLSGCPSLTSLSCGKNRLTALNVSGCPSLTSLGCSYNQLTSLDVSACHALQSLTCVSNELTQINLHGTSCLRYLTCQRNQLASLDVSECADNMYWLICSQNQLTELDLGGCPGLIDIYLNGRYSDKNQYGYHGWIKEYPTEEMGWRKEEIYVDNTVSVYISGDGVNFLLQPENKEAYVNDVLQFRAVATGVKPSYQWQYRYPGGSWQNSGYVTAKSETLRVRTQDYYNGMEYRCVVRDAAGTTGISDTASVTVLTRIIASPRDVYAVDGNAVTFRIEAKGPGLTYQWQYKYPGEEWKNSGFKTGKSAELKFTALEKYNNLQYRCIVTDANGSTQTSSIALLTVRPAVVAPPVITQQPVSVSGRINDKVQFTVAASGTGLTYQWQYKYPDGSWTDSTYTSARRATLGLSVKEKYNGMQYRCIVTDEDGRKVTSASASLTVLSYIGLQPGDRSAAVGDVSSFYFWASGPGLTYQWQYKYPDGNWTNSGYVTAKKSTLRVRVQDYYNGMQYRCVLKDANGQTLITEPALLTLRINITEQPQSLSASVGDVAEFHVTATGAGLTYRWQYKYPDGDWTDSGYVTAKQPTLRVRVQNYYNGMRYRCLITDANGKTAISSAATLTLK